MLEMAIVENIQRADLNAMEVAFSLQRLLEECKLTHEELSVRVGKQRSTVSNFLRLLKLPPRIQQAVRTDEISMGHARAILGLDDISAQLMVLGEVISKSLSVRETEKLVGQYQDKPAATKKNGGSAQKLKPSTTPAEIRQIESQLRSIVGSKVEVKYKEGVGEIRIPFSSDRELNEILEILQDLDND
jgi:ParB family chromosome partitioning protein